MRDKKVWFIHKTLDIWILQSSTTLHCLWECWQNVSMSHYIKIPRGDIKKVKKRLLSGLAYLVWKGYWLDRKEERCLEVNDVCQHTKKQLMRPSFNGYSPLFCLVEIWNTVLGLMCMVYLGIALNKVCNPHFLSWIRAVFFNDPFHFASFSLLVIRPYVRASPLLLGLTAWCVGGD